MSSLLTNTSAMVALQTLKTINRDLSGTQAEISTGKRVATAKDNAAIWGVAAVMQSDVSGFKAISESLGLGSASLTVAQNGAETITGLLQEMKARIVAAQESNVDRAKIQADVNELRNQILATVDASQFNGLNLLKGVNNANTVKLLGSLNRDQSQTVSTSEISVVRQSLETAGTVGTAGSVGALTAFSAAAAIDFGATGDLARNSFTEGDVISLKFTNSAGQGVTLRYEVKAADVAATATVDALATAAVGAFNAQLTAANAAGTFNATGITLAAAAETVTVAIANTNPNALDWQGAWGGGLAELATLDVSTQGGAAAALDAIEEMIAQSVGAAAAIGSSAKRVELQAEFVSKVSDSLTTGIGALVDADMEAASARLQALQVQQQLGIQALSIANQSPQNILALFR